MYLRVDDFKDHSPNRMFVEGKERLTRGICGVSLNEELIHAAIALNADLILVHHPHGFWNEEPKLPLGAHRRKLALLLGAEIAVFGYHLPLDGHPEVGNNALLADLVGLKDRRGWMPSGKANVALHGEFAKSQSLEEILAKLAKTIGEPVHLFEGGPEKIRHIAICSGGAAKYIVELLNGDGIDLYLTGEASETAQQMAREEGFHWLALGHHATERLGITALAAHLTAKFGLPIDFVDVPNPV
jgi:dinuclear metal center YbgI/SA1388 family protein